MFSYSTKPMVLFFGLAESLNLFMNVFVTFVIRS